MGIFERLFQLVQLEGGERGAVATVFLARGVIAATLTAVAAGIVIVPVVSGGAGLVGRESGSSAGTE